MRTRGCRVKPIGEILRFVGHQSFAEFHDAHRVRWHAVIGKYEFSDPEIAAAEASLKLIKYYNHGHAEAGRDQNVLNGTRMGCAYNEGAEYLGHLATSNIKMRLFGK